MADTLQTLSVISYVIAGICFALAVILWFRFKIPDVINDLTGKTAKKTIAKMRSANEKSGVKFYKQSATNVERGKLTVTASNLKETKNQNDNSENNRPETGLLDENKSQGVESVKTEVLDEVTDVLDFEATQVLDDEESTPLLNSQTDEQAIKPSAKKIEMLEEVTLIHTSETI